ncbi:polysaccharide biosynthesis protein [Alphaproteobacteria bacterium]|nr:polysaccharide biosynthesis protein [Alphaproteobacteria bacterium]
MNNIIYQFLTRLALNLPRNLKRALAIFLDTLISISSTWLALSILLEQFITFKWTYVYPALVSVGIAIPVFISWGLYRAIFRYSSNRAMAVVAKAIAVYALIYILIFSIITFDSIPRSIGLMQPMIMFFLVSTSRWLIKNLLGHYLSGNMNDYIKKGVVIYGAGDAGRQLASSLRQNNEFKFISFIDENRSFWGGTIDGSPVASPSAINHLIKIENAKELWLAIPNDKGSKRQELINRLRKLPLYVRTLPSFSDLAAGRIRLSDLRELDINELLGRDALKPDYLLLQKCISEKTVMVTGAGGSIGSELCRQILSQNPRCILLIENSEVALYNVHAELKSIITKQSANEDAVLIPLLINIQDKIKLIHIFETWKPETVYHAAAYKHVPMVESNVVAGITNNVIGTLNCAKIAIKHDVKHFVLVSTDKAVRPTNIMGASKRLAEMALQSLWSDINNSRTCLSMVRFGNVLGSSGSVVPLFRKQIEKGGPITLTHRDITRYFMTIPEAAQLVIHAGAMAQGGEVFVLDMGKPVRIIDLARNMIEAAGLMVKDTKTPWGDIEIKVTGMRPGEKLYEELLIDDNAKITGHPRILHAHEAFLERSDFDALIQKLTNATDQNNISEIRDLLIDNVSGYIPSKDIVDWISLNSK